MRPSHKEIIEARDNNIREMVKRMRAKRLKTVAIRGSIGAVMDAIYQEVGSQWDLSAETVRQICSDPKKNSRYYERKNGEHA